MSNKFYLINKDILTALHKFLIDKYKDSKIFADKINITNGYLSQILSGNRDLSKKFRLKFETLEGFPLEDLLKEDRVAEPQALYPQVERRKNVLDRRSSVNENKLLTTYSILTDNGRIQFDEALKQLKAKYFK